MDIDTARMLIARGCIEKATIFKTPDGTTELHLYGMPNENHVLRNDRGQPVNWHTLDNASTELRQLGWRGQITFDVSQMRVV